MMMLIMTAMVKLQGVVVMMVVMMMIPVVVR